MIIIVNETQHDFFVIKEAKANEDKLYLMTRLQKEVEKTGNKHLGYINNNKVGNPWIVRTGFCEKMFAETGYIRVPAKMTTKICVRSHDHTTLYNKNQISIVEGKTENPKYGQTQVVILTDDTVPKVYSQQRIAVLDTDMKTTPLSEDVIRSSGPNGTCATTFTFIDRSFASVGASNTYIWISDDKKLKVGVVTIKASAESDNKIEINALIRCHADGSFMMEDKKKKKQQAKRKGGNQGKGKKPTPQKRTGKKPCAAANKKNVGAGKQNYSNNKRHAQKNDNKQYNNTKKDSRQSNKNNKPKNGQTSKSLSKLERNKNKYN
ncbi:hypothetical protein [Bacteroides acidifaciens]|uniref:hypothetical protein n=1 Tax=Bacteroides acidifaciens TaxID=85831 RepID=UPI0026EE2806|nr:hypothetical protein [Bacteroides acidifaciens]